MAEEKDNLDALCDLLEEDDSFDDDEIFNLVDEEVAKIENEHLQQTQSQASQSQASQISQSTNHQSPNENNSHSQKPGSTYVNEMEEKLKKMQEEMLKMQKQLEDAKKPKKLEEIDVFKASCSRSATNAPRSPVKTNPFAEQDRPRKSAQYHPETPQFGPKLSQKTTRVLTGEDKLKFQANMKKLQEDKKRRAMLRNDLTYSSDEDAEDPTAEKYNSFGKEIKRISRVSSANASTSSSFPAAQAEQKPMGFNNLQGSSINLSNQSANKKLPSNMIIEKHSRIRIANPTITQVGLDLSLMGRKMINMNRLRNAIIMKETDSDWTTVGVLYMKSTQKSKNGNTYTMWKMTDLAGDVQTVTVLLFGKANTKHYSMPINKVIGLLNPKILDDRQGKGDLSLSVDHPDKIMEMGDSVDVGKCQSKKADGSGCTNVVNSNSCEYCTFHVKKAYQAMSSKRAALQSSFSGGGDARSRIMSKIDPKSQIFGGGQMLNQQQGLPGKRSMNVVRKDQATLASLGVKQPLTKTKVDRLLGDSVANKMNDESFFQPETGKLTFKSHLNPTEREAVKKVTRGVSEELGMKLLAPTPGSRLLMKHLTKDTKAVQDEIKNKTVDERLLIERARIKENQNDAKKLLMKTRVSMSAPSPKLGRGIDSGFIDLDMNKRSRAAAILASKGKSLAKNDPNYVMKRKRSMEDHQSSNKKVAKALTPDSENLDDKEEESKKVVKSFRSFTGEVIDEKKMEELRNKKSMNQNLANDAELEEEQKYFDYHEKKEAMEEKMVNTKEIDAKVVTCKICNYSAYKQSDLCKSLNHWVKSVQAKKRFFECKKCKKRTYSFDKMPKKSCPNCKESSWIRVGMMRERQGPVLDNEKLLIRGQEEKFIGQNIKSSDLHINL